MKMLVNHLDMSVLGYCQNLSVAPGEKLIAHVSSIEMATCTSVIRLDRFVESKQNWEILERQDQLSIQEFELGSWIEVPVGCLLTGNESWCVEFNLKLLRNIEPKVLLSGEDFEIKVSPGGYLFAVADGSITFADHALPTNDWHKLEITVGKNLILVKSNKTLTLEMHLDNNLFESNDCVKLGSSWEESSPTLNCRVSDIRIVSEAGNSNWPFPALGRHRKVDDASSNRGPLVIHGYPTFSVPSPKWSGEYLDPRLAPEHYQGLHLHEDDRPGFDWPASYEIDIPTDAESGVYALRVTTEHSEEDIPFFVRPSAQAAKVVFIVPTMTYQAYANEALPEALYPWLCEDRGHRGAQKNKWLSLYDTHKDGSGVTVSSWPVPWLTLRMDYKYPLCGDPHGFPIDIHSLRFFADQDIKVDIITDHDLHKFGLEIIEGYRVLVTGSHPEYWTSKMLDTLDEYVENSGSLAYLGGNGFYWACELEKDLSLEVRRGQLGIRTWESSPGENHLATSGEPGGLWRWRGRAEHRVTGIGTSAMGFTKAQPYVRHPESFNPKWSFLFKNIPDMEIETGGLLLNGPAGYEVDCVSEHWGTPNSTIILASASTFDDGYTLERSDMVANEPRVPRSDLCIRETSSGGLVFSVGSVSWCACLPGKGETNAVGFLTSNFLRVFETTSNQK